MFKNIIDQNVAVQLRDDIIAGRNAPAMLFYGPGESAKGSTALETARVLSCEKNGDWNCSCPSCGRHRYLLNEDLLVLGNRQFSAEIAACKTAFLRNHANISAKMLFYRSLRKLQLRFSPVLTEGNSDIKKLLPVLQSFDEKLYDLLDFDGQNNENAPEKLCDSILKDAAVLEKDGKLNGNISIAGIRSASWWCRIAPNGRHKTLIIENAGNLRDDAHNSLLKLLEEPPATVSIVLTAKRREVIIPTILSRLRQYRFFKRETASEMQVIRQIFRDESYVQPEETKKSIVTAYLESFINQNSDKIYPLAAWFIVSIMRIAAISLKKTGREDIIAFTAAAGKYYAPIAETLALERTVKSSVVIKIILSQSKNFDYFSFTSFMQICLDMISEVTRTAENPQFVLYNDIFRKNIGEAVRTVEKLNINKTTALEWLLFNVLEAMKKGNKENYG